MGQDDNLNAAIAHVVLGCVAGPSLGRSHVKSFSHPGMHTNLFIHGVIGFLHYGGFKDIAPTYKLSLAASRYLPIPCLMADLARGNDTLSLVHLLSGLVPFVITVSGSEDRHFGNLMLACNIVALACYSYDKNAEWGWYTAGTALVTYFAAPQIGAFGPRVMYPLGLALMDYCAYRIYRSVRVAAAGPQ